ncbi:MAG TPA: hypothetical protein VGE07_25140 [Herpetosiphonaceae bacterium]
MQITELVSRQQDGLRCEVCQWHCVLQPGQDGRCLVRRREGDEIVVLSDTYISAAQLSPIEDYGFRHFFPDAMVFSLGSWGTPFPAQQDAAHYALLPADPAKQRALDAERAVKFAQERLARGVIWTYNDPVVNHEYLLEGMRLARAGSRVTGVVTGGFWTRAALDQIGPYLDGINLYVYGFSKEAYAKLTGVSEWKGVLAGAERAVKHWGCHLEITTPISTGINDSSGELEAIAKWLLATLGADIPWRIIPAQDTDTAAANAARQVAQATGLKHVYGTDAHETTRCPGCGWAVVERREGQSKIIGVTDGLCDNCATQLYLRTSLFKKRPQAT